MAVFAITSSSYRNAVSRLHGQVSQEMFQSLWPSLPVHEVPITPVTNGVHLPTWLSGDLAQIYDVYLAPDWRERYPERSVWDQIPDIPNNELWEFRRRRKRQLINFVRERLQQRGSARACVRLGDARLSEIFDPEALTIGFSRRFATYKRATLLFKDVARLKKIVNNPKMPVQIIIAGKAHPLDNPGKQFIREIIHLTRDPELARHVVFLEDYDISVGRELVQGVDLWLNNPRRGEEACGTSGMKAAINGTLNLSILDGWFDEAYEVSGGWAIGDREDYTPELDDLHASAIYSLLESEIVPMYYQEREEGVPTAWMQRVKQSIMNLSPMFNCQRMLHEYASRLYEPAHQGWLAVRKDSFQAARERVSWSQDVHSVWHRVHLRDETQGLGKCILSGSPVRLIRRRRLEVAQIRESVQEESGTLSELFQPGLRRALLLAVVMAVMQQWTGINTILFYGSVILNEKVGGQSASAAIGANVIVGLVNFFATIIALWTIDIAGAANCCCSRRARWRSVKPVSRGPFSSPILPPPS